MNFFNKQPDAQKEHEQRLKKITELKASMVQSLKNRGLSDSEIDEIKLIISNSENKIKEMQEHFELLLFEYDPVLYTKLALQMDEEMELMFKRMKDKFDEIMARKSD